MTYKAYWGTEADNFGDLLNKNVLDYCGVQHKHTKNHGDANLFCIGSVIRLAKRNSIILGSGIIKGLHAGSNEDLDPTNTYEFVRGPRTRARVLAAGCKCPEIYGDPALLVPRFVDPLPKKYKIGFVPHYKHKNKYTRDLAENKGWEFIDVSNKDPLAVVQKITQCSKIVSTSLHGIIVAHAYGIPAAHLNVGDKNFEKLYGENTKFIDYYESVKLKHKNRDMNNLTYEVGTLPDLDQIESLIRKYANV